MEELVKLKRGMVVYVNQSMAYGFEQATGRPGIIVSSEDVLEKSNTMNVVYLTTTNRSHMGAIELVTPKKRSWAKCNEVYCVDKSRVLSVMCELTEPEMLRVELGLRKTFALSVKDNTEKDHEIDSLTTMVEELNLKLAVSEKAYNKLLDKYVDMKLVNDLREREVMPKVEEPEIEPIAPEEIQKIVKKVNVGNPSVWHGKAKLAENATVLNINMASTEDFMKLGIGEATAKNIVSYRRNKGQYNCKEDLLKVPRFGKGCMAVFGDYLKV